MHLKKVLLMNYSRKKLPYRSVPGRNVFSAACHDEKVPENLASSGSATQSSQYNNLGSASNAIDRKRVANYMCGSCTHTNPETNPWWRVDLLDTYNITSVTITNRWDCCGERIAGAEIHVGNGMEGVNNPLCAVIREMKDGEVREFACGEMEGRYVTVVLPGKEKKLSLCEVEVHGGTTRKTTKLPYRSVPGRNVFSAACHDEKVPENLASSGSATQSSQYNNLGSASNAIDRKRVANYMCGSCTHTNPETNPWWRVDLLDTYNITSVTITNRWDCCGERIAGAEIHVGNGMEGVNNPLCAVIREMKDGEVREFACGEMEGRYVTVVLPGKEKKLSLCEVEVHGGTTRKTTKLPYRSVPGRNVFSAACHDEKVPENLASSGSATQSSQYNNLGSASNAIDRKRVANYMCGSCTHTNPETNPWWRVDLLDTYNITSVTITNRWDCCGERIAGAEIHVGNGMEGVNNPLCAVIREMKDGEVREFACGEMEGRYVTVVLPGKEKKLSLCEVEVHGGTTRKTTKLPTVPGRNVFSALCKDEKVPENLASSGSATQSSQYDNLGSASNAIDRKRGAKYMCGSCTHTNPETNPWWRVDLLDTYNITSVTITNRWDCCGERIAGAEIHVGNGMDGVNNPLCAVIHEMKDGEVREFACGEMEGRYVTVVLPGKEKKLSLCEVEVHSGTTRKTTTYPKDARRT
ncbi:uncharacterized protein [Osmerus mordax]|uniref:uncharacterized protein n=1 Tax=Osmerus mordax TaxID=8014 RepID=UPI00350EA7BA